MYVCMDHFSSINHMLYHKTYVNEFWKTEITLSIITDHNGKKLEDKTEEKLENSQVSERCSVASDSLQHHGLYSPGILQARTLEWAAFPFSRGSSQPREQIKVSHRFFTNWTTKEAQ